MNTVFYWFCLFIVFVIFFGVREEESRYHRCEKKNGYYVSRINKCLSTTAVIDIEVKHDD